MAQQSLGGAHDHNWKAAVTRIVVPTLRLVAGGVSLDATENLSDELGTSISDFLRLKRVQISGPYCGLVFFECLRSGLSLAPLHSRCLAGRLAKETSAVSPTEYI